MPVGVIGSALGGESVLKGRSMFAGREGEKIAAPIVEIVADSANQRSQASSNRTARLLGVTAVSLMSAAWLVRRLTAGPPRVRRSPSRRRTASPATVIALIALVIATSGVASWKRRAALIPAARRSSAGSNPTRRVSGCAPKKKN